MTNDGTTNASATVDATTTGETRNMNARRAWVSGLRPTSRLLDSFQTPLNIDAEITATASMKVRSKDVPIRKYIEEQLFFLDCRFLFFHEPFQLVQQLSVSVADRVNN